MRFLSGGEADERDAAAQLIQADVYLGTLSAGQLLELWPERRAVSAAQVASAREAWAAFRGEDPRVLAALAAAGDHELPMLAPALQRVLEELPGTGAGLARTERQLLEAVAGGAQTPVEAFLASQAREQALSLGDLHAFGRIDELAGGERRLLDAAGGRLRLTADGEAVLAGAADRVALIGFDRWLGGLHLSADAGLWRWDPARGLPVRDGTR